MTLTLTRAFSAGIDRATTRTGAILLGLLLVLQFVLVASINTVVVSAIPPTAAGPVGLTLPISGTAAAILLVASYVAMAAYFVVLARAFTRPIEQLSTFPDEIYTRRIVRATIAMVVAGMLAFVAIMIGFALLVIPGIFLSICFMFVIFTVAVEDRGVVGSLRRSWALSRGNRLKLAVIVLLLGLLGAVIGILGFVFELAGAPLVGDLVSVLVNGLLFVVVYGILAALYLQLAGDDDVTASP